MDSLLTTQPLLEFTSLFARRGRLIRGLFEGDPVAWACLIGAVVIVVGIGIYKSWRSKQASGEDAGAEYDNE